MYQERVNNRLLTDSSRSCNWMIVLFDWPDWSSNPAHVSSGCWGPHWHHRSKFIWRFITASGHSQNPVPVWEHGKPHLDCKSLQSRLWVPAKMCSFLELPVESQAKVPLSPNVWLEPNLDFVLESERCRAPNNQIQTSPHFEAAAAVFLKPMRLLQTWERFLFLDPTLNPRNKLSVGLCLQLTSCSKHQNSPLNSSRLALCSAAFF